LPWPGSFVTFVTSAAAVSILEVNSLRQFKDRQGIEWQVILMARGTHSVSRDQHLPEHFREGWLLFQSRSEKRRFAPPPANWESLPDEELIALLAQATPHTLRGQERAGADDASAAPADRHFAADAREPLRPQLRDIEHRLEESLGEVCDMPAASKLDTGELIRVEETLAIAAEAAKEAVSLRRKLRADRERDHPEGDAGAELPG